MRVPLTTIVREWGRIGVTGFGGPPAHIALLRRLCVQEHEWIAPEEFEHALAATGLIPGPASTQLAIYCAWQLRGPAGALAGGIAFIVPGLIAIIALAALFLSSSPPRVVLAAGAGAGAAVAVVAVEAARGLAPPLWRRADGAARLRVAAYAAAGFAGAALSTPYLVAVLLGCGLFELAASGRLRGGAAPAVAVAKGGLGGLAWMAFKVGALTFGGGFVIVPLMQADAVHTYHWMTDSQFLNAVALGQVTPGPVVQTVAVVGYAAGGVGGALLAAFVAFAPSFVFVLLGAGGFARLRGNRTAQSFLTGAAPAAVGAMAGAAIPLAAALTQGWQFAVLAAAAVALLVLRRGVVQTLLAAGAIGVVAVLAGAPLPH
jgi:chromate transporter